MLVSSKNMAKTLSRRFNKRASKKKEKDAITVEFEEAVEQFVDGILQGKEEHLEATLAVWSLDEEKDTVDNHKQRHRITTLKSFIMHLHGLQNGVSSKYHALQAWAVLNKTHVEKLVRDTDLISASVRRRISRAKSAQKLVVLDFDKTIAAIDVSRFDATAKNSKERVFGSEQRFDWIVNLLNEVTAEESTVVTIVSYNMEKVINKVLSDHNLTKYFKHVYGREAFMESTFPKKSAKILELMLKENVQENAHVLFADDNTRNVKDVTNNIPGSTVLWVERAAGITLDHKDQVLEWVKSPR